MMGVIVVETMSIQFIVLNVNATIKKFVRLESLILMLEMAIATMKQILLPVCMMVWSAVDLPSIQNIVLIANAMVYTITSKYTPETHKEHANLNSLDQRGLDSSFFFTKYIFVIDSFTGCDWSVSDYSCCSSSHPCGIFEGDCDSDDECVGQLLCGKDNCHYPFPSNADCCYDSTPSKIFEQMNFIYLTLRSVQM